MVKCGTIDQPASISNITIWGIVTFVIMAAVGVSSFIGFFKGCLFEDEYYSLMLFLGSMSGIAALILVILSLNNKNANYMKMGSFWFFVSCGVHTLLFSLCIVKGKEIIITNISQLLLDTISWLLFERQSKHISLNQPFDY